jgi:uncharacterized membrane protein YhaH (DUF805 family)
MPDADVTPPAPARPASAWRIAFDGRIPRLPYTLATLALTAAFYGTEALGDLIADEGVRFGFTAALLLIVLLVQLSFDVRRLHDLDLSGHAIWVGLIAFAITRLAVPSSDALIQFLATWGWRTLLALVAGTRSDNEFGPSLRRTPR